VATQNRPLRHAGGYAVAHLRQSCGVISANVSLKCRPSSNARAELAGWASYLRSVSLPRASADVRQDEATLNPSQEKRLSESISEPTADDVRRLVRGLTPRIRRVLTTTQAVALFLEEVASQLKTADRSPTGGGVEGASPVATRESCQSQGSE
jgi:hypothetical protein